MSRGFLVLLIGLLLALPTYGYAADTDAKPTKEQLQAYFKEQVAKLHPQHGKITLKGGIATLNLPEDFGYLDPKETNILLHNIWGTQGAGTTLGSIIPMNISILSLSSWGVIITYSNGGHIAEDGAEHINYDAVLEKMKAANTVQNKKRKQAGYPQVALIGWAKEPHYDKAAHKLYWAEELASSGTTVHDLNYNIRLLGRNGVLAMSVVSTMEQLPAIEKRKNKILSFAEFSPNHRYTDFIAATDKLAPYDLAALITGPAITASKTPSSDSDIIGKVLIIALLLASAFFIKRVRRKMS